MEYDKCINNILDKVFFPFGYFRPQSTIFYLNQKINKPVKNVYIQYHVADTIFFKQIKSFQVARTRALCPYICVIYCFSVCIYK